MAVESGWSVRDLLCTATHFIAETVALALRKTLPEDAALDELIVTGGGQHNGMLLREIAQATSSAAAVRGSLADFRGARTGLHRFAGHALPRQLAGQRHGDHRRRDAAASGPADARLAAELAAALAVVHRQRPVVRPLRRRCEGEGLGIGN